MKTSMSDRRRYHGLPDTTLDDEERFEAELARREAVEGSKEHRAIADAMKRLGVSHRDDSLAELLARPSPVGLGDRLRYDTSRNQPWLTWWAGLRWQPDSLDDRHELVRSRPAHEQPAAVGRPREAGERARAAEDAPRLRPQAVGVEEQHVAVADDREAMGVRSEGGGRDASCRAHGERLAARGAEDNELVATDEQ